MSININIVIIGIVVVLLLFMFFRSRKTSSPSSSSPTEPPIVYCNNHGFVDENGKCQCDDPWYGQDCEFSQTIEGINMSNIYKTVLAELDRIKSTKTTDVRMFGQAGDYYIKRASDAPGQKSLIGSSVERDILGCAEKSSSRNASFFTYQPQTKVCESYSEPSTMSLTSLKNGDLIVGCKKL